VAAALGAQAAGAIEHGNLMIQIHKTQPFCERLRLPAALLTVILQKFPAARLASAAAEYAVESPATAVLKAAVASVAALGAVDSMVGASTVTSSPAYLIADVAVPANVSEGQPFKMDVTVAGVAVTFAKSWDVTNTLPPGITVQGASLVGNLWVVNDANAVKGVLTISGTPTATGSFNFTVEGWENTNRSGNVTGGATTINVVAPTGVAPSVSSQPASQTVDAGSSVTLKVAGAGSAPLSYQWQFNGTPIVGATASTYAMSSVQVGNAGTYTVVITNSAGSVTSQGATLTVNAVTVAPVFAVQPQSQTIAAGSTVVFSAAADAAPLPTYQWERNGAPIPGATSSTLVVNAATVADAGDYACVASNAGGSPTSHVATLTVSSTPDIGRLVNISCRAGVGTGGNILIVGFAVGGQGTSGSENLFVRASGPALVPFGVTGTLSDPELELFSGPSLLGISTGWGGASAISTAAASVGAFPWADTSSRDSALLQSFPVGPYTASVSGLSGDTGVALAEVYDDTPAGTYTPSKPRIVNISARVPVGTGGNVLIAGFVIGGSTSRTVLIRASGPALIPFKLTGTLADPLLQLFSGTTLLASNTAWGGDPQISAAAASVGAFTWNFGESNDSAILVTLPPGLYSAEVSGASGDTGIALVEVYEVP